MATPRKRTATKKTRTKKTTTKKAAAKKTPVKQKGATKTKPAEAKAVHAADQENARLRDERAVSKDGMAASERAMAPSKAKTEDPALAATEKSRKAAIAEIDKNIGGGTESEKQDHEVWSPKENANDANLAEWQEGKTGGSRGGGKQKAAKKSASKKGAKAEKAAKPAKPKPPKRVSLLDAAATVLAESKEPMAAKAMVDAVVERGLWTPGAGKTPAATLYAAVIREIAKKGDESRFCKVDRGQFVAAGAAGKGA